MDSLKIQLTYLWYFSTAFSNNKSQKSSFWREKKRKQFIILPITPARTGAVYLRVEPNLLYNPFSPEESSRQIERIEKKPRGTARVTLSRLLLPWYSAANGHPIFSAGNPLISRDWGRGLNPPPPWTDDSRWHHFYPAGIFIRKIKKILIPFSLELNGGAIELSRGKSSALSWRFTFFESSRGWKRGRGDKFLRTDRQRGKFCGFSRIPRSTNDHFG